MNKIFAAALAVFGVSGVSAQEAAPQLIDPATILFSVPTISNDTPPAEHLNEAPSASEFLLHEDDWSQLEFFPKSKLAEVKKILSEYKNFEENNREMYGWRNIYTREIERIPVVSGATAASELSAMLGAPLEPAPVLYSSSAITGRVSSGFSIPLGGNVTLYGYSTQNGIPVLGASVGENPDDQKLIQAFLALNKKYELLLIDWRQQLLLTGQDTDGSLSAWRPQ